jgi:multiple sugar transport system permease protein
MNSREAACDPRDLRLYYKRRAWARVFWIYLLLLVLSALCLGVFYSAFVASLRPDPTLRPFTFAPDQVRPMNILAAARLGAAGGGSWWTGGWREGGEISFTVTMGAENGTEIVTPTVSILNDRRQTKLGAALAVEHARISEIKEVSAGSGAIFQIFKGANASRVSGSWKTFAFSVRYQAGPGGSTPAIDTVPLQIEMPKTQAIVSATLPPSRIERRGRAATWQNISPGAVGYVFANYLRVFSETRDAETGRSLFAEWIMNSFKLSFGRVIINLAVAVTAGYALARLDLGLFKRPVFFLLLFVMIVPAQVLFISNYLVLKSLGLLQSMSGAILIASISAGQVFVMKQFFESIPKTLEEAAYIEGASRWQTLIHVVLPLSAPALLTVTITSFQAAWNDFFWPLIILNQPQTSVLPVGLLSFRTIYGSAGDWGLILAGAFISVVPIVVMFFVFQRYFVTQDINAGVKG